MVHTIYIGRPSSPDRDQATESFGKERRLKSSGFQLNVDQELAIALFDRVGITILLVIAATAAFWLLKR